MVVRQDEASQWRLNLEHHEVHAGDHYTAFIVDEVMSDGEVIVIDFKTPNTNKVVHLITIFTATIAGHIDILEAGTWTRGSISTINIINSNRNSSNTSGILQNGAQTVFTANSKLHGVFAALQSLANTTNVFQQFLLAAGGAKEGGKDRGTEEVVLKKNTTYVIRFTADGNSNGGAIRLSWYEHQIVD